MSAPSTFSGKRPNKQDADNRSGALVVLFMVLGSRCLILDVRFNDRADFSRCESESFNRVLAGFDACFVDDPRSFRFPDELAKRLAPEVVFANLKMLPDVIHRGPKRFANLQKIGRKKRTRHWRGTFALD